MESWQLLSRQDQNRNLPRVDSGDGFLLRKEMLKQVLWNFSKKLLRDSGLRHANLASCRSSAIILATLFVVVPNQSMTVLRERFSVGFSRVSDRKVGLVS